MNNVSTSFQNPIYDPSQDPTYDPTYNQPLQSSQYYPSSQPYSSSYNFSNPFSFSTSNNWSGLGAVPQQGVNITSYYTYVAKIAHNKALFIIILYLLLLVFMFLLVGMTLGTGTEQTQLTWAFYGFSIVTSIVSIFAVMKSYKSKTLGTWGMGISSVLIFGLLIAALTISKPKQSIDYLILTYIAISIVFLANLSAISLLKKQVFSNSTKRGFA